MTLNPFITSQKLHWRAIATLSSLNKMCWNQSHSESWESLSRISDYSEPLYLMSVFPEHHVIMATCKPEWWISNQHYNWTDCGWGLEGVEKGGWDTKRELSERSAHPTAQAHDFTCSHRPPPRYERVLVWAQLIKHVDPDSPQGAPFSGPGGKGNAVNLKTFWGEFWWYWFYSRLARESRAWLGLLSGTWVTQRQLYHHKAHSAWSSLEHPAQLAGSSSEDTFCWQLLLLL